MQRGNCIQKNELVSEFEDFGLGMIAQWRRLVLLLATRCFFPVYVETLEETQAGINEVSTDIPSCWISVHVRGVVVSLLAFLLFD